VAAVLVAPGWQPKAVYFDLQMPDGTKFANQDVIVVVFNETASGANCIMAYAIGKTDSNGRIWLTSARYAFLSLRSASKGSSVTRQKYLYQPMFSSRALRYFTNRASNRSLGSFLSSAWSILSSLAIV